MKKTIALFFIFGFLASVLLNFPKFTLAQSYPENSWVTKAPLPQALTGGASAVANGKIYFLCGSSNYAYDPTSDSWTPKKPMPTPRTDFAIAEYQNNIYIIGGTNADGSYSSVNEIYDTVNDSWTTMASIPTARSGIEGNVVNGKIYVMGGENYSGYINLLQAFPQNDIYNIATNSWSSGKSMPVPVYAYSSAVIDNKIYYLGGANHLTPNNLTQIYDPQKNSWTFGANFSMPMMTAAAAATTGVMAPKRIYLFGGTSDEPLAGENNTQVYDPANNSWSNGTVMPSGRSSMAAATVDDLIYVIGGNPTFLTVTGENDQYTPFGYGTPQPTATTTVPEFSIGIATIALLITTTSALVIGYKKRHTQ